MIFLFPRWDMLIPWRVVWRKSWNLKVMILSFFWYRLWMSKVYRTWTLTVFTCSIIFGRTIESSGVLLVLSTLCKALVQSPWCHYIPWTYCNSALTGTATHAQVTLRYPGSLLLISRHPVLISKKFFKSWNCHNMLVVFSKWVQIVQHIGPMLKMYIMSLVKIYFMTSVPSRRKPLGWISSLFCSWNICSSKVLLCDPPPSIMVFRGEWVYLKYMFPFI